MVWSLIKVTHTLTTPVLFVLTVLSCVQKLIFRKSTPIATNPPRWRMPLFATAATEWPQSPRVQRVQRVQRVPLGTGSSTILHVCLQKNYIEHHRTICWGLNRSGKWFEILLGVHFLFTMSPCHVWTPRPAPNPRAAAPNAARPRLRRQFHPLRPGRLQHIAAMISMSQPNTRGTEASEAIQYAFNSLSVRFQ